MHHGPSLFHAVRRRGYGVGGPALGALLTACTAERVSSTHDDAPPSLASASRTPSSSSQARHAATFSPYPRKVAARDTGSVGAKLRPRATTIPLVCCETDFVSCQDRGPRHENEIRKAAQIAGLDLQLLAAPFAFERRLCAEARADW